jgi:natural product biosynthesis luciferase-like monooxygenase protein
MNTIAEQDAVTLPLDHERPPVSSYFRETVSVAIGPEIYSGFESTHVALLAALNAALYRYTTSTDIAVGLVHDTTNENRHSGLVGLRTRVFPDQSVQDFMRQLSTSIEQAVASNAHTQFRIAFRFSGLSSTESRARVPFADALANCDVVLHAKQSSGGLVIESEYDSELFDRSTIEMFLRRFHILLEAMATKPTSQIGNLQLLTPEEIEQQLVKWNDTQAEFASETLIHHLFEVQAQRTPQHVAVVFEDRKVTYCELNARANQLAHHLGKLGVGTGALVGICVGRSMEMIVGLLAILKSGGAYVPLDPNYPRERLSFMLQDSNVGVLLTEQKLLQDLPEHSARVVRLDSADSEFVKEPDGNPSRAGSSHDLAYVIYTSGSTGKPKGVMVSHRNVVNFFAGMDRSIGGDAPGVWLAATSISFDISVLELFWTLCRGFTVVIYKDEYRRTEQLAELQRAKKKKMDFSLLYFSSDEGQDVDNRYRLLLEGAKFADEHGFDALWTPERHFHAFGGLFPNPSVTSAAVAAITRNIKIRAGSVVLPLQNPIRVAEEWSVVDNISNGRVGVSFASGWQMNDFVLAPQNYSGRKEVMLRGIETVRKLWRGETLQLPGVNGDSVPTKILPRPIQPELPIWLTATGNPETCRTAGQLGANLLTHLVGQKIEDLAEKIAIYRNAWRESGHEGEGHVTLMLHTFVGEDLNAVRETVREPFSNYLKTSVDLLKSSPWGFAPARLPADAKTHQHSATAAELTENELSVLLEHAFDRYFENSSLFGTPDVCVRMVDGLRAIGVDEIACLIDFGVDSKAVLESLHFLNEVRERSNADIDKAGELIPDYSLASLARQHGVTHFQCTPSLAVMLLSQPENREWFDRLRRMMIGGEALPASLAKQLKECVRGTVHNMYGPTETTVWSTTETLDVFDGAISIGRPIANTQIYLLDPNLQLVPVGYPGEICIGGDGVVRGYLNRPDLTAQKFILNPFSEDPESRLYRTGDLALYRSDGRIEFLGRMDDQVKIRGHRIELAEIEAILGQHSRVRECAVVARVDLSGDKKVIAYVALRVDAARDPRELRNYLATKLPDFMVPSLFVFLDRLPQTPNGKTDRRALAGLDVVPSTDADRFVAPRTPLEEVLAGIWAELLGVDRVGVKDNFFELGGHSLLAAQLMTRLREVFRIELSLGTIFEEPTVSALAAFMIAKEPQPGLMEKTAVILKSIDSMSEGEVLESLHARPTG